MEVKNTTYVTISCEGNGTTDPTPDTYEFPPENYIDVEAIPDEDYRFDYWTWTEDENYISYDNPVRICNPMWGDIHFVAHFSQIPTNYDLTINCSLGGTTNPSPGVHSYSANTNATVSTQPNEGCSLRKYEITDLYTNATTTAYYTPVPPILMDNDKRLDIYFNRPNYNLTISATSGGTTNPTPGTYPENANTYVEIQAIPNNDAVFKYWTNGSTTDQNPTITIHMEDERGDQSWQAVFSQAMVLISKDGLFCGQNTQNFSAPGTSKHYILSTADPILIVESNTDDPEKSAIIENLELEGDGNNAAIVLRDVEHCYIRNVSILNCKTGIKLITTNNRAGRNNQIEHVRMLYIQDGIEFSNFGGTGDFSFTHIKDVTISLDWTNLGTLRGIVVGDDCKLNGAFIKATVWSNEDDANYKIGMQIKGQLKHSMVNLCNEVSDNDNENRLGMDLGINGDVSNNQSVVLATSITTSDNKKITNRTTNSDLQTEDSIKNF
jgi:hypothetical protein